MCAVRQSAIVLPKAGEFLNMLFLVLAAFVNAFCILLFFVSFLENQSGVTQSGDFGLKKAGTSMLPCLEVTGRGDFDDSVDHRTRTLPPGPDPRGVPAPPSGRVRRVRSAPRGTDARIQASR